MPKLQLMPACFILVVFCVQKFRGTHTHTCIRASLLIAHFRMRSKTSCMSVNEALIWPMRFRFQNVFFPRVCVCACVYTCLCRDVSSTSSVSQSTYWCPHPQSSHIPAPRHLVLPSERWLTHHARKGGKNGKNSLKSNINMTDNWLSRHTKALVYVKGYRPRSSAAKFLLMPLQLLED